VIAVHAVAMFDAGIKGGPADNQRCAVREVTGSTRGNGGGATNEQYRHRAYIKETLASCWAAISSHDRSVAS
jgi:hypothetical protein